MDENTLPEPTLEQSIQYLLDQVPPPVRNFVLNDLQQKTAELMARYQIHVDQGGILEREFLLMLLGQEEPAAFVTELQNAGIPAGTVRSLVDDINKEVFMKLRQTEEIQRDITPQIKPVIVPTPEPEWVQVNAAQQPVVVAPISAPVVAQIPVAEPDVRTMASDMELVKTGGFHPQEVPAAPVAAPTPTISQFPQPTPAPVAPKPSENRDALHAILKEYGVDPYREPTE